MELPVDENGAIEHKVDFTANISEDSGSNSWDEEDSYEDYGEEFANFDESDYYNEAGKADDELKSEIPATEPEDNNLYDIDGNIIP